MHLKNITSLRVDILVIGFVYLLPYPTVIPTYVYNGMCYFTSEQSDYKTQTDAMEACRQNGAHLLSIDSKEEETFLLDTFFTSASSGPSVCSEIDAFYLSPTDKLTEGKWLIEASHSVTWANWAAREPDNKETDQEGADCVYVSCCISTDCGRTGLLWYDARCSESRRFICEKPCAGPSDATSGTTASGPEMTSMAFIERSLTMNAWMEWSHCIPDCISGVQTAYQLCNSSFDHECVSNVVTSSGVIGYKTRSRTCRGSCPFWGNWTEWSACNDSCEDGAVVSSKTRECHFTTTALTCAGPSAQYRSCPVTFCEPTTGSTREPVDEEYFKAADRRASAITLGTFCLLFLICTLLIPVILDLPTIAVHLKGCVRDLRDAKSRSKRKQAVHVYTNKQPSHVAVGTGSTRKRTSEIKVVTSGEPPVEKRQVLTTPTSLPHRHQDITDVNV